MGAAYNFSLSRLVAPFSLPPPLWGRVGVGGKKQAQCLLFTPHPALRADLPRKGGGKEKFGAQS
jgi:hypothetical protein